MTKSEKDLKQVKTSKIRTFFSRHKPSRTSVEPGRLIRDRRQLLGWKSIELAAKSGVNPRTINAIEMGRIQNPSFKNLEAIAGSLGLSLASLFSSSNDEQDRIFLSANQKGHHVLEFHQDGFRVISYTPLIQDLFVGKVMIEPETEVGQGALPTRGLVFIQPILGKLGLRFDGEEHFVREGNYVFFSGVFPHSYFNAQMREVTFLLITTPSFLAGGKLRAGVKGS